MRRIGDNLGDLVARLGESDGSAGRALRRAAVHHLWETSVRCVFKDAAPLVLEHTNAVYVLSGEQGSDVRRFDRPASETRGRAVEGTVLVVYADDSMVRSELDNRQELLKMKFNEQGEDVELFKIVPSTRDMKNQHPFRAKEEVFLQPFGQGGSPAPRPAKALTDAQQEAVRAAGAAVEDQRVRLALERAMTASKASENGESEEN